MTKSIERRLYEALRDKTSLMLTVSDVDLLVNDDAIATRIANAAAVEAGLDEPVGGNLVEHFASKGFPWVELGRRAGIKKEKS